jgi:pSer/pThr/pTyr-binding forkhead associated (FHA) protein
MKLSLMVLNAGKASGQTIPITLPQFIIGRDPTCNLRPASAMISKQHCALIVKDGKVYLKDFDSTNGTSVNNQPVKGTVPIKNGDQLKVGPLAFKVVIEGPIAVNKPTPPPVSKGTVPDDAAAALLLSLDDEQAGEPMVGTTVDAAVVPEGSTVFELPAAGSSKLEAAAEPAKAAAEPAAKKPEAKKPAGDSAQNAAQAILDRFKKGRGRPTT